MDVITANDFARVIATALERMAFVVVEPVDDYAPVTVAACAAHAAIDLRGPRGYELCVSATPELVREVASGMLGVDTEDVDAERLGQPTVGELANVLAGELLMQLTGGDGDMWLGLPRDVPTAAAVAIAGQAIAEDSCVVVGSGAGRLVLAVRRT